ncbi:hypothetical protein ACHAQD_011407 [Fusarium lateritium]
MLVVGRLLCKPGVWFVRRKRLSREKILNTSAAKVVQVSERRNIKSLEDRFALVAFSRKLISRNPDHKWLWNNNESLTIITGTESIETHPVPREVAIANSVYAQVGPAIALTYFRGIFQGMPTFNGMVGWHIGDDSEEKATKFLALLPTKFSEIVWRIVWHEGVCGV